MIQLPTLFQIIKEKDNYAQFSIEGLYPGYGVTIGNALRRVLLSSMEGAAVLEVKIKGVEHEFSTIPGVLEDVINICLNLKKLRFKIYTDEPQKATLQAKGKKEIKGGDFEIPSQLELVNKDLHIATLTSKDARLEMEILVGKGIGYEPVEERKKGKVEIGKILLDAVYTPIKRVSYKVENMRVGKRTDFDRLLLEIETDGTISPKESLLKAIEILVNHYQFLRENLQAFKRNEEKKEYFKEKPGEVKEEKNQDFLKIKVEDLNISNRSKNALLNAHLKTVGGILRKKEEDLLAIEGFGKKGIEELKRVLKKMKLELK